MSPTPEIADSPARVLIVDDERHNRQVLEVMLAPEGYRLMTANGGEEALALVAQQPPDLVLLDIMMPGMDGYEVVRRLKAGPVTRNIPVILITALDDRNSLMLGLNSGADDFLTKPVDRCELCVRVRNMLRIKAYGDHYERYSQMLEGEVSSRTADLVERSKTLEQQTVVLSEQAALLNLARDAIVVRDMHDRILFWNHGAELMYGWPSAEALGKNRTELLSTRFPEAPDRIDAALLRDGCWDGELTEHTRGGAPLTVASRWALQRDASGTPVRILTITNNVTARKQAETELLLLNKRLSLATDVAKVGVWEWDLASNTLAWDATMFEIYGFPHVVPMPYEQWTTAVHPDDLPALEASLQKAIADKGEGLVEFRIILLDGSIRNVSACERVVLDERGNASRLIGVNMDVTARKRAEQALEQSRQDQMRFKDEFLSHVSHELRSPLTAIKQFSSILLGGIAGELNAEQREYQQIVLKNIGQLQSMIDDLLEVTRLETGKLSVEPDSVSVSAAAADIFKTLQVIAEAKGLTFSCDVPSDLPSAHADETRLRQILIILLDNAIKFTPEGGSVTVQARVSPQDARFLVVDVADTGVGISPEMSGRIFERLYQASGPMQASRKGLGLGLFICKELVTRQGGQIWVKSDLQKGSTFSFTLPVVSLTSVLAPLLKNGRWPAESVALVMVETSLADAWPSRDSQAEWSYEARSLLQRCLLPVLDVLLPRMISTAGRERFFVAAFADETGAAALANRIRSQFERVPRMKQTGVTFSVSYNMLEPVTAPLDGSTELVSQMAAHLEQSINSHIISEVVYQ